MRRIATALSALGFFWAAGTTVYLLTTAGHDVVGIASALPAEGADAYRRTASLVSANGPWIVGLLSGVTLLAGMPFGVALTLPAGQRTTTWTVGLLALGFSLVTAPSIGVLYLPTALVLVASASLCEPAVREGPARGAGVTGGGPSPEPRP